MKTFLFIAVLFLYFGAMAQTDTSCVQSRWVVVKNTDDNKVLFDPNRNILTTVKELTHEFKLLPYHEACSDFERRPYRPTLLLKHDSTFIDYTSYLDTSHHVLVIYAQSDVPFVDEYGDPLTSEDEDGNIQFLYEEPIRYIIELNEIHEIRIREDRIENSDDFQPTEIGFYAFVDFKVKEIFWINFEVLSNNLMVHEAHNWYSFIQNREYTGFQYKQTSCYDTLIRH